MGKGNRERERRSHEWERNSKRLKRRFKEEEKGNEGKGSSKGAFKMAEYNSSGVKI